MENTSSGSPKTRQDGVSVQGISAGAASLPRVPAAASPLENSPRGHVSIQRRRWTCRRVSPTLSRSLRVCPRERQTPRRDQRRRGPRGRVRGDRVQRPQPPRAGGRGHPAAGRAGDPGAGLRARLLRPQPARRPQRLGRPARAGRHQPVLHHGRAGRGGPGRRVRPDGDAAELGREPRAAAAVAARAGRGRGAAGRRRLHRPAVAAGARHPVGAAGPRRRRDRGGQQRVRGPPRRRPGRRTPPGRPRTRADRVRERAAGAGAVPRPPGRAARHPRGERRDRGGRGAGGAHPVADRRLRGEGRRRAAGGGPRRRPQAVFCANDQLALGLLKGLGARG